MFWHSFKNPLKIHKNTDSANFGRFPSSQKSSRKSRAVTSRKCCQSSAPASRKDLETTLEDFRLADFGWKIWGGFLAGNLGYF